MSNVKHTHDHMQILCTNMVDKLGQCKLFKSVFLLVKILKIFAGNDIGIGQRLLNLCTSPIYTRNYLLCRLHLEFE